MGRDVDSKYWLKKTTMKFRHAVQKFGLQTGCGFILKHTLIEYLERMGFERLAWTKIHVQNKYWRNIILQTQILFHMEFCYLTSTMFSKWERYSG